MRSQREVSSPTLDENGAVTPVVGQNSIRAKDGPNWGQSRTERGDPAAANRVGKMTGEEICPIGVSADWRSALAWPRDGED